MLGTYIFTVYKPPDLGGAVIPLPVSSTECQGLGIDIRHFVIEKLVLPFQVWHFVEETFWSFWKMSICRIVIQ